MADGASLDDIVQALQNAQMPAQQGPITLGTSDGPMALPNAGPTSVQGQPLTDAGFWPGAVATPPAAPGPPLVITPTLSAKAKAAGDDWVPPTPTMVAPTVTPLGAMATIPQRAVPAMGVVLGRR